MKIKLKQLKVCHVEMTVSLTISIFVYYGDGLVSNTGSSICFYDSAEEAMNDWLKIYNLRGKIPSKEMCE
jgi:hypothetical protein